MRSIGKIVVLLGTTSTGKTSLSLKLAKIFKKDIVSFDSRQVYKYMDIGTGKVKGTHAILKGSGFWIVDSIKIHGFDLVLPDQTFSAFDFYNYFANFDDLGDCFLVGGTGFYLNFLLGNIEVSGIGRNEYLRKELENKPRDELFERLLSLDPVRAEKIDRNNPTRLIRAIEVASGGRDLLFPKTNLLGKPLLIGLFTERKYLYTKIDRWVDEIFEQGLKEEVLLLMEKGYKGFLPMRGLIYKTAVLFAENKLIEREARERIKFDVHAYARRQETYFKKIDNVTWFDVEDKGFDTKITRLVESYLDV